MREETLTITDAAGKEVSLPLRLVHTLVIGSGAAGLNAAVQLKAGGVDDVLYPQLGCQGPPLLYSLAHDYGVDTAILQHLDDQ